MLTWIGDMKFRKRNDLTVNGVRQGYDPRDAMLLRRETHTPKTQIFRAEELEDEPEDRDYFCVICKSKLDYIKNLEMWTCSECSSYYDTKIQDVPVKNISQFRVTPWFELQHYPTTDVDDIEAPYVEGIDHSAMLEDRRIQIINLHNVTFADAIPNPVRSTDSNKQMPEKGYVLTEEHKRKATEGVRKFYSSPESEATRKRISEAVRSRPPISKETRERMSKAQKLRYKTQPHAKPNLGKHLSSEWCSKISKGLKQFYSRMKSITKGSHIHD